MASGAANRSTSSSVSACTIPATGVRAPERMFVAVRAIAPVAGRPPSSGTTMLAMPCAVSSMLGSWRSPAMRSATVADMSDSMAPSMVTVRMDGRSGRIISGRKTGTWSGGSPDGMPPKREPIVSTERWRKRTASVPRTSATMAPGTERAHRWQASTTSRAPTPSAATVGENVPSARPISISRGRNTPEGDAIFNPSRSLTCVLAIKSAIPFVNPTTTGRGRNRTAAPRPVRPINTSRMPASNVHR